MNGVIYRPKLCFMSQSLLLMIKYLLNTLILKLKVYYGPETFYGHSKFGQFDKEKNRAPFKLPSMFTKIAQAKYDTRF